MTRSLAPFLLLAFGLIVGWNGGAPASAADGPEFDLLPGAEIPLDPRVRTGQLDNGLRWYVQENQEPAERAELQLVVNVGSVLEEESERGLAHFLEHMAFNGTEKYESQELVDYLERIGMRFGPDINALTSFDRTIYMLTVPTDEAELLETGIEILGQWSRHIALDSEEVVKERGVILEERRLRLGSSQRVQDQHLPATYHGSLYADRLPIGEPEIIENATAGQLRAFYRRWYRPELMAVVAVGDFDAASVIARIESQFGGDWGADDAPARPTIEIPGHERTLVSIATDPEISQSSLRLQRKLPRHRMELVAHYREAVLEGLYDRIFNERLFVVSQRPDPPFTSAFVGSGTLGRTLETESLMVGADEGELLDGLQALLGEARRVEEHGFTAAELERAKARNLSALEGAYAERDQTPSSRFARRYARHFLAGAPAPGIEFRYALSQELLPRVELAELNALERPWSEESNRVILVTAPEKEGLAPPTEAEIREVFAQVARREVAPWVEETVEGPLLSQMPEPGPVVRTETVEELELTIWTLANGVKVFHKPTDFQDDEVLLQAWSPGGLSLVGRDPSQEQRLSTFLVTAGGVGDFSRVELDRALAGKRAGVRPSVSTYQEGLSGRASPTDLQTLLELTHLYFTEPRRDEEAVASLSQRMQARLRNREVVPGQVYSDSLRAIAYDHHPLVRPLQAEDFEDLDLDPAFAFYRERFADADDFHFFFVGNVEAAALRPLVERYLGSLPAREGQERWRDVGLRPVDGPLHRVVRAGVEPKAQTTLMIHGPMEWTRAERNRIRSTGDALRIRLREVLREELSGTYGVSASAGVDLVPEPRYTVSIRFGCDPDRLDELVGEVERVIASVREEGFGEGYLEKVQESLRRGYEEGLESNGYWMSGLVVRDRWDLDQRQVLETPELIDSLTAEQLHQTARKILDWDRVLRFDLLPLEDSGPGEPGDLGGSPDSGLVGGGS